MGQCRKVPGEEWMKKLPIGIQGFEKLREAGFVYVDKSEYIYQLVRQEGAFFLSRPRRFGKSLLISTLKAYWEGKKELFAGLKIENLLAEDPEAWKSYPVFHFDFNGANYQNERALDKMLDEHLRRWEKEYEITDTTGELGERFRNLLIEARKKSGLRCVVLVDEYDKSLLEALEKPELEEHNKAVFKGFFGTLKGFDEYLQFVFITGVTKFEKVSIFSDLNQLRDISLSKEFAGICGITEQEIEENFGEEISATAENWDMSIEECRAKLKACYDGYHFHPKGEGVYNPFSLLSALAEKDFGSYWFSTGTPTFLVRKLKKNGFEVPRLTDGSLYANEADLTDYRADDADPIPLLYQTGYLTIADFDRVAREYTLAFPNEEVKYGFLNSLIPEYLPAYGPLHGNDVFTLRRYAEQGNTAGMEKVFTSLFASIPYTNNDPVFEHYFQSVIYLVFVLLGHFTKCEMHTYLGRVDCVVECAKFIYLFEFKLDKSAEEALQQIEDMKYADVYAADPRKVYRIGANFSSEKRGLTEWKVEE